MKMVKPLLLAATVFFAAIANAQTVDEIIAKHIDAIGGKEKLAQIKSLYMESDMEVMGSQAPMVIYILNGKGFKNETDFNGQKIISCVTDKGGWAVNPMGGSASPEAMPEDQYKAAKDQIFVGGALFDYAAKGYKAELLGKEGEDYKIKVSSSASDESTYYINGASYYVSKTVKKGNMQGQEVQVVTSYADYKKTDFGYVLPYASTIDFGGFALSTSLKKVEINKAIEEKVFDMPK